MITLTADTWHTDAVSDDDITTGSVGIPVRLVLSPDFDGHVTWVCFRCGGANPTVPVGAGPITVPAECLKVPGEALEMGVYAARPDGTSVIPTRWARAGIVRQGVEPSDFSPSDPEPSWAARLREEADEALRMAKAAYRYHIAVRDGRMVIIDTGGE